MKTHKLQILFLGILLTLGLTGAAMAQITAGITVRVNRPDSGKIVAVGDSIVVTVSNVLSSTPDSVRVRIVQVASATDTTTLTKSAIDSAGVVTGTGLTARFSKKATDITTSGGAPTFRASFVIASGDPVILTNLAVIATVYSSGTGVQYHNLNKRFTVGANSALGTVGDGKIFGIDGVAPATLSATSLNFDNTQVGSTSQKILTVTNGATPLTVGSTSSNPLFTSSPASLSLATGAVGTVTVTFAPTAAGPQTGSLTLRLDRGSSYMSAGAATVALSGTGVQAAQQAPAISLSPTSLTFDSTAVGANSQKGVTISNTGTAALSIGTITLVGADAAMFKVSPTSMILAAGAVGTVTVGFFPTSVGLKAAALSLSHNASISPTTVGLTGVGKQASTQPPPTTTVPDPAKQDTTKLGVWLDLNTASGNQMVASGSVAPGAEVTIQVFGRNLTSAISYGVTLGYDPAVLTPVTAKISIGDYLTGAIPLPAQVSTSGGVTAVTFGAAVLGGSPKSGSGFLGTAVFKVSDTFTSGYTEIKVNRLTLGTATAAIQTSNAILRALKNAPPVAKFTIKPDAIKAGDTRSLVTLDASGSSDPDGDAITFKWSASAGMTFKKSTSDTSRVAQAQISAEVTSNVVITLTVTDKSGAKTTATQTLKVIVPPSPTAAVAVDLDAAADNQNVGLLYGAKAGDTFTLQVFVRDVTGGTGYSIKASYDTAKVGTPTYAHGPLIAGAIALPAKVAGGVIEGGASILGGSPVSGSGLLSTFTFKAKDGFEGGTTLSVTSINLQMGTSRKELVTGSIDAQITADVPVKAAPAASFDEDGDVDFDDFFALALHFNTTKGDPGFDSRFDLDGDGDVDFEDFFAFAVMFGLIEE